MKVKTFEALKFLAVLRLGAESEGFAPKNLGEFSYRMSNVFGNVERNLKYYGSSSTYRPSTTVRPPSGVYKAPGIFGRGKGLTYNGKTYGTTAKVNNARTSPKVKALSRYSRYEPRDYIGTYTFLIHVIGLYPFHYYSIFCFTVIIRKRRRKFRRRTSTNSRRCYPGMIKVFSL